MRNHTTAKAYFQNQWNVELQFPYSADLVEALKAEIPSDCRSWDPDRKIWSVFGERRWTAIAVDLLIAEYPGAQIIYPETRQQRPTGTSRGDVYAVLHLLPTAPPELVQAAYRTMSKLNHPDTGGDLVAMQIINTAYDKIQKAGAA